jgi:hypothetical protein
MTHNRLEAPAQKAGGGPQPGIEAPSKQERVDFLKQAIAFTEWNIRSYDTKAQISIAAFVLSMNPLWSVITSAYPQAGSSLVVAVLVLLFVATVLLFGFVIWPVTLRTSSGLAGTWETKGLFYVGDPNRLTASLYTDRLKSLAIEAELAAETLKLAAIREIKSRRFRRALVATIVFYSGAVITLLLLRNCGAGGDSWACRY